ncbi:hypothetical protein BH11MYX2_BH11MYX2_08510 [soil metagenome]
MHWPWFMLTKKDAVRARLVLRRRALIVRYRDELARVEEELAQRDAETVERSTEEWDASVLSSLGEADIHAMAAITAAIQRLEDGTYGRCEKCESPINEKRLDALPEASTCIACATGVERIAHQSVG